MFDPVGHLGSRHVARVLERIIQRIHKYIRRHKLDTEPADESSLAALAGPQWRRGRLPMTHAPATFDKPMCVTQDGFTLHAATDVGAMEAKGREALVKYILRPPISQERVTMGPDGLVRIVLKRPYADGTYAVDMDPLSLLCRLASAVPAPKFHTVRYVGVLGPASTLRSRVVPVRAAPVDDEGFAKPKEPKHKRGTCTYIPWAELLRRTFQIDVVSCPTCQGRMQLVAMVTDPKSVTRMLRAMGEPCEPPAREPARGPPYFRSQAVRRLALHPAA